MTTNPNKTLMADEARSPASKSWHPNPGPGPSSPAKPDALTHVQQQQMNKAYEFAKIAARGVRNFDKDRTFKTAEPA